MTNEIEKEKRFIIKKVNTSKTKKTYQYWYNKLIDLETKILKGEIKNY